MLRSLRQAEGKDLDIVLASDGETTLHQAFRRSASLTDFPYVLSQDLGMAYRINRLPFAVVLEPRASCAARVSSIRASNSKAC